MSIKYVVFVVVVGLVSFSGIGVAAQDGEAETTIYVDQGNTEGPWDGASWETAFQTVQEGVDAAGQRTLVVVGPGLYQEEVLVQEGHRLAIESSNPSNADVVAATIIDGAGEEGYCLVFSRATEWSEGRLRGLSIQNFRFGASGWTYVQDCVVRDTFVGLDSCLAVSDCLFHDIEAIAVSDVSYYAERCRISDCGFGVGAMMEGASLRNLIIWNCTGGIGPPNGASVSNCVMQNVDTAFWVDEYAQATIRNCIIWGGAVGTRAYPTQSCIEGGFGGVGNISRNPRFVDPENGDFHLLPNSPCIDAGRLVEEVTGDFEGTPRPYDAYAGTRGDGSDYDMGAFEFVGLAEEPEGELEGEGPRPPSNAHWIVVEPDADGDYLKDGEETRLGLDPEDSDENGNGTRDGVELARAVAELLYALPWYEDGLEDPEGELYMMVYPTDSLWSCPVNGDEQNFDEYSLVNLRLDDDAYLADDYLHYMYQGSFSLWDGRRVGVARLLRLLETDAKTLLGIATEEGEPSGEPEPEGEAMPEEAEPNGEPEPEAEATPEEAEPSGEGEPPEAELMSDGESSGDGEAPDGESQGEGYAPSEGEAEPAEAEANGEPEPEAESFSDGETSEAESPEGEKEGEGKPDKFLNCGGLAPRDAFVPPGPGPLGDVLVLMLVALCLRWGHGRGHVVRR